MTKRQKIDGGGRGREGGKERKEERKIEKDMWNILLPSMNICHCDGLNKEADWAVAGKVEVRWKSQIETFGNKDGVRSLKNAKR